ncbi:UNVERIFIED_CONTAM: Serine/arginine-rich SC35-like splicing factor SCL33 [Sesamum calycinum]|uniref:Serine/arginine-rich SC35-like splicing factor SCL33 n=1 Tax=Sesamum calycinum TaxID=2727403 RepID=A0AAW2N264_9LAMI
MGRRYSRSPSPSPTGYSRRYRSPSPRGRYRSRAKDLPTSLLVRNLRHDCRPEDLREPFGEFGPLKDIYLPRDYYTGNLVAFGFVQYVDPDDAAEAKYQMDDPFRLEAAIIGGGLTQGHLVAQGAGVEAR